MKSLTLKQLRTAAAINEHKKLVHAAKALGLSQPAVTLQLRDLEEQAGTLLFQRTNAGMRPTAAGQAVIDTAHAIENQIAALADEIAAIKGATKGALRLGVASTAKYFAPFIIAGFLSENPGLSITLTVGNKEDIFDALGRRDVDIALSGRPPRHLKVHSMIFGEHPLVMVASRSHPLAWERNISKRRIAQEHFLLREPGSGTRGALELYLGEIPEQPEHVRTEMGSNETIKQAVIAGLGIALISAHTIAPEVESGRLAILDVEGLPILKQWFAVRRSDQAPTPVLSAFETFLMARGASYLPDLGAYLRRPAQVQAG